MSRRRVRDRLEHTGRWFESTTITHSSCLSAAPPELETIRTAACPMTIGPVPMIASMMNGVCIRWNSSSRTPPSNDWEEPIARHGALGSGVGDRRIISSTFRSHPDQLRPALTECAVRLAELVCRLCSCAVAQEVEGKALVAMTRPRKCRCAQHYASRPPLVRRTPTPPPPC